jgi:hemerythrin-like domain-containing protein
MCDYCGCRSIKPIGDLSAEHVEIQNLAGDIRRAVANLRYEVAGVKLAQLINVLREHDAVEELSIYPAMARHPEYRDKVDTLFDEHDDLDSVLEQALETISRHGAATVRWDAITAQFETLLEHISHEENGLFPAAAIALDTQDWEDAERVRSQYRAALDRDSLP